MKTNSAVFISDMHINREDFVRYTTILKFFNSLESKIDHLFMLGDIFEFWYNDRSALREEYQEILAALKTLTDSGIKLVIFEGNHDICYGNYFKKELGATVYRKCNSIDINNHKVFLGHGDELVKNDPKYKFCRWLLRLLPVKWIITFAPSRLVLKIALAMSKVSRKTGRIFKTKTHEQYKEFANQKLSGETDYVILGHSHVPEYTNLDNGVYINCGNWLRDYSYVDYKDNKFELKYLSDIQEL